MKKPITIKDLKKVMRVMDKMPPKRKTLELTKGMAFLLKDEMIYETRTSGIVLGCPFVIVDTKLK